MLVRLTRKQRKTAGWLIALVYLLCLMAPTLSYAMPGEQTVVHCATMENMSSASMHAHDEMLDDGDMASMSSAMAHDDSDANKKGPHTGGPCCALMCLSIMPAWPADVAAPSVPTVIRVFAEYRRAADNAPEVHYRPPIS